MNESGYSICRTTRGKLVKAPAVKGEQHTVSIPNNCPVGTKRVGAAHLHPGGDIYLSSQDKKAAHEHKLKFVCVEIPSGETKCFNFKNL